MRPVRWKFRQIPPREKIALLSRDLNLHPIVCQILINRGLESQEAIRDFLKPDLKMIHNPFLLKDMKPAVERLTRALKEGEKIMIFGDYDVDGLTASALLYDYLVSQGGRVHVRLPNRIKEGYGLTQKAVHEAHREGITLTVTVDCGSSDHEAAEYARSLGIDLIITDHHHPPDVLPPAFAVINPKQAACPYPFKDLAGVGVALKMVQALTLFQYGRQMGLNQKGYWPADLNAYLDLVCLGTIADIMPLTGENRVFVKFGLEALDHTQRPGLVALKEVAGIKTKRMTTGLVGFALAPRINATGRIKGPEEGLKLLLTQSPEEGAYLAGFLDHQNQKRRQIEEKMLSEARKKIQNEIRIHEEMLIVLSDQNWHPGVIGIVAHKLTEEFYRPTIMIAIQDGVGKGSARSIPYVHLYELLSHCEDLLKDFGGHAAAAGLTIEAGKIPEFKNKANQMLRENHRLQDWIPEIPIDAEMDYAHLDFRLIDQLEGLSPFGSENPEPSLCLKGVCMACPPRLLKDAHLKVRFKSGHFTHEGIGFNMRHIWEHVRLSPADRIWDVAFYPQINDWQGQNQIQLRLKDIKAHVAH